MSDSLTRVACSGFLALLCPMALVACAETSGDSWMSLNDQRIALADAKCGEIFDGEEYIMQSNGDEFLKLRFERLPGEAAFNFSQPRNVNVALAKEGDAYYLLDRSEAPRTKGDKRGVSGSALLRAENEAARALHPDGLRLEFSLNCRAE
ncbi:hypothetical protein [Parahaliea mediterranea]|uniref:DUF2057 domain-containing protein n=1 Tax=Parahaliea mediterranea TaxID=651086 RepID=A0A939DFR6_9GAMM|nr:hypothetical protein [Parahaliea mediterranea]MBN7797066.1 hypothetical protein [Parahaliea mediterranea]